MYTLSKKFRFEAAHRLMNYEGKCAHLHGHSWNGKLFVNVKELDHRGMALDFGELSVITKKVEAMFDHATLVSEQDRSLLEWLRENKNKHFVFPLNPTSEVIGDVITGFAAEALLRYQEVSRLWVTIEETCTSMSMSDNIRKVSLDVSNN